MEYRTQEQFDEIQDSVMYGNLIHAGTLCKEYGFHAQDLIFAWENSERKIIEVIDLVELAELAQKARDVA